MLGASACGAQRRLNTALYLMRFSAEIWHVLTAILVAAVFSSVVVIAGNWPAELDLVFNSLFYWSFFSLFLAIALTVFLYLGRIGRTRHLRALFSVLLILLSAMLYLGFEEVASNTARWHAMLSGDHGRLVTAMQMVVSYAKTILAFGIAAFGANLLADAVPRVEA